MIYIIENLHVLSATQRLEGLSSDRVLQKYSPKKLSTFLEQLEKI